MTRPRSLPAEHPAVIVMAKSPQPGRSKTRLTPPLTPAQAAAVAAAALDQTLDAVGALAAVRPIRPILALDGPRWAPSPEAFRTVRQRGRGLARRLAHAFDDVGGPALLVGMDTPQASPDLLSRALDALLCPGVDAVLGPAEDGGWWALGLRHADPRVFARVPMSTPVTGGRQAGRLDDLGLRWITLPTLRDVDRMQDALAVAAEIPHGRFAEVVGSLAPTAVEGVA